MVRDIFRRSKRHQKKAHRTRVWLNDVEVTHECQYADDRVGRVLLIKRSGPGTAYVDPHTGDVAKAWHHGRVRMAEVVLKRSAHVS